MIQSVTFVISGMQNETKWTEYNGGGREERQPFHLWKYLYFVHAHDMYTSERPNNSPHTTH